MKRERRKIIQTKIVVVYQICYPEGVFGRMDFREDEKNKERK